jgi:hypothetical protein
MAMLHKWATGSHSKDNTKNDAAANAVIQASGDFAYELPNSEPSEVAGTVGAASTPYTLEKAKSYSATGRQNSGGATKTANQTTKKLEWYNILRMLKWRKILKMRDKVGVNPDAPTTNLYEA